MADPTPTLSLGMESKDGMSAADILHVRARQNYLVEDFTRMERLRSDPVIGGTHAVLAFHAQRQMGVGSAIGVQILGLAVIGLAPQLVEPGAPELSCGGLHPHGTAAE